MAGSSGSGRAGINRARNAAMAAYMKQHKIERHTGNCPMCHRLVARETYKSSGSMMFHIMSCKGRKGSRR